MPPQEAGVERTGVGQAFEAQPGVRRQRAGIPGRVLLAQQFAQAARRGGTG